MVRTTAWASSALLDASCQPRRRASDAQRKDDKKAARRRAQSGSTAGARPGLPAGGRRDEGDARRAPIVVPSPTAKEPARRRRRRQRPADVPLAFRNDFLKAPERADLRAVHRADRAGQARLAVGGRLSPRGAQRLRPARSPPAAAPTRRRKDARIPQPSLSVRGRLLHGFTGGRRTALEADARLCGARRQLRRLRRGAGASRVRRSAPDAPVKVAVLKHELTVPNFHADELQTSSVIVADKIDQLSAPLAPEAQKERPYVLGDAEIVPAQDLKFKKTEELQVIFQVYGAKIGDDKKPDLTVDYVFHQKDSRRREGVQQDAAAGLQRAEPAAELRSVGRAPDRRRPGGAARVVPGGRFSARDQGDGQQDIQDPDARRAVLGRARVEAVVRRHACPDSSESSH